MKLFSLTPYFGKRVCVAFSGGADSVCLLHYFATHAEENKISLSAIHVEHGIRGEESLRDMRFCEALCKEWGIPLRVERVNIPALAEEYGCGVECAARTARVNLFCDLIRRGECDLVATAHHRNDVAETILFRLARGTSPAGMRTIAEYGGMIRPLLHVSRVRILQYIDENSLSYVEDSTNSDETYTRNYIRHTVLPAYEKIHGGAVEHLVAFAEQCVRDNAYLTELALKQIRTSGKEKFVPVDLPDPLFSRACFYCMDASQDYTAANFKEISKLKRLQSGRKICLPGGMIAMREYGDIVFYHSDPAIEERPFVAEDFVQKSENRKELRADLDRFPLDCVLRSRREGDFIVPYGGQKKTLKKFLSDKKISARIGKTIPLVACGCEILVVMGVEISDKVKVTENTERIGYF